MTDSEIKDKILECFNEERQRPELDFQESHFLDFLTFPAHPMNTVKNTFKGVRRYYRFMNRLEIEFGICFSLSDLDKYYSVDSLAKKVLERMGKRRGNIMILKQRNEEKEKYILEIILTLILVLAFTWLGIHFITIALTILFGIAIYWTLRNKIHNRRHNKKLTFRILRLEE